jgi:hypothetical protein
MYKNGSTSVKNFFGAFEKYLSDSNVNIENSNNLFHPNLTYVDPPWKIHSDNELSKKFIVDDDFEGDDVCSIVVLRNPLERFSSFWFNKMVLMGEVSYFKLATRYFPNSYIENMDQVRECAKQFLESSDFQERLTTDIHLHPQYLSIQHNRTYDFYIETSELNKIPLLLSEKFAKYEMLKHNTFPHFNSLVPEYSTTFYDEQLVDSIKLHYSEDFALLDFVNISSISKAETTNSENFPVMEEINKQRVNNLFYLLPSIL